MRCLIEKDIRLVFTRKSSIFIFLLTGAIFTWSFSVSYSGAYITELGTILAISTISYDDLDNCMAFILTLPCTRKQYVLEKYLFVYGFSSIAGIVGMVIIITSNLVRGIPVDADIILEILASEVTIMIVTGGLMIPLQLKFGPEKSRVVFLVIIGIIFVIGFLLQKIIDLGMLLDSVANTVENMSITGICITMVVVLFVISIVSFMISTRIMENKEIG